MKGCSDLAYNKKIMSPAGGLGHKQAGGFAIVACLFVPHI
jgi:nanoRNase/pAp phosphatase (c-di-AMP/oligoRNAs hydrolase)|tara:strand:+ start:565 stop:684 length:120 start_codon:yes stop_codon:yes gene_type:complete